MKLIRPLPLAALLTAALAVAACSVDSAEPAVETPRQAESFAVGLRTRRRHRDYPEVALVDCVRTPSQTEGPYYFDTGELRRDITEGLPGAPLLVSLRFVDADTCEPVAGATVDIWHTDHIRPVLRLPRS